MFFETTYLASKYNTVEDKDPARMNENIKSKIKTKNILHKQYIQNGTWLSFLKTL